MVLNSNIFPIPFYCSSGLCSNSCILLQICAALKAWILTVDKIGLKAVHVSLSWKHWSIFLETWWRSWRLCCNGKEGRTILAVACSKAAGWREWNISQSGCTTAPMNKLLYAFTPTWVVWEAGSWGQKSSDDLATTVFSILHHNPWELNTCPLSYTSVCLKPLLTNV